MATLLVITVLLPLIGAAVLFLRPGLDYRAARGLYRILSRGLPAGPAPAGRPAR